jgi:GxxExxY protein
MGKENVDPLTYAVIGTAMEVHTELGPGLDEEFYHRLLAARLHLKGTACESKVASILYHRNLKADEFECDLIVHGGMVGEFKVISGADTFAPEHLAQLICYLKFWRVRTGLLFDFGKERLIHKRVVFTEAPVPDLDILNILRALPDFVTDMKIASAVCGSLGNVLECHGLGYWDTTYRGLIAADLSAEQMPFVINPKAQIIVQGKPLGEAVCKCFVVAGKMALLVRALRNGIGSADRAILQTYLKHLGLDFGLVVNFGKRRFDMEFVGRSGRMLRSREKSE